VAGAPGEVEQPRLKVAALPSAEVAALQLAIDEGYMRKAGIPDVEVVPVGSDQEATDGLVGGSFDVAFSSYIPFIRAHATKTADLRIVSDNSSATPRTAVLAAPSGSGVQQLKDLEGKRIAVPEAGTLAELMVKSTLTDRSVDVSRIRWVPVASPDMAAALVRGQADAAMMVEPYITDAARLGIVPMADLATGPLQDLPSTGFAMMAKFAAAKPKTVAAFQRAMVAAARQANEDRRPVQLLVSQLTQVSADVATMMAMPRFGATLSARRVQRVSDLMLRYGLLQQPFDVAPMLLPSAQ
jgi:NitT/TauT family transport system substrate-binding protein